MLGPLATIVALEEIQLIDTTKEDFDFEQWKRDNWWDSISPPLAAGWTSLVSEWIANTTNDHVRSFRILTRGASRNAYVRHFRRLAHCTEIARRAQTICPTQRPRCVVGLRYGHNTPDFLQIAHYKSGLDTIGVFYSDPGQARLNKTRYGIRVFRTLGEAVSAADEGVVFDLSAPAEQTLNVLAALPGGAAVVLRNSLGENSYDAGDIRRLCDARKLTLAVDFPLRWASFVVAVSSLIDQDLIGALRRFEVRLLVDTPWDSWSLPEATPRSEILSHSIHYIDLVRYFMKDPTGVCARTVVHPRGSKIPATRIKMMFNCEGDRHASIWVTHRHQIGSAARRSFLKWVGTDGTIEATLGRLLVDSQVPATYRQERAESPQIGG